AQTAKLTLGRTSHAAIRAGLAAWARICNAHPRTQCASGTCQEDAITGAIMLMLVVVSQMEVTREWTWLKAQAV
ncbi:hypothetical protein N9K47_00430, partial [bacterium]|nr:hypothetical protein [bacterium]